MKPLSLSLAGRGEDNAAHGGQVAHISAAEAELLKRLGGAASINPVTGLPEYYTSGVTGNPGASTAAAATAAIGSANAAAAANAAANAMGLGAAAASPGYGGHGLGFTVGNAPSSSGTASAVAPAALVNAIAQNPTMYGVEGPGGIGDGSPGPASSATGNFGIVTTTDGTPVTTTDGVPVMHGNLSGRVANTAITKADVANAKFFNQVADTISPLTSKVPLSLPAAILGFFAQMAQAQTPQNVANTRGAIALAGPGMGAPSAAFGGGPTSDYSNPMGLNTTSRPNTRPQISYGGYTPPAKSAIAQFLQSAAPQTVPATAQDPVVSTAPVNTAPVTALLQVDPEEEGFSPAVQRIRQLFFESLV
jgi:hypothetical protein